MKNLISHTIAGLFQLSLFFMTIDKLVQVPKENLTKRAISRFLQSSYELQ